MSSSPTPFGQNEWLVEEMYRKFCEDPSSVDASWHEFLADYAPEPVVDSGVSTTGAPEATPAAAGEPKSAAPAKVPPKRKAASVDQKAPAAAKAAVPASSGNGVVTQVLRGAAAAVVKNMSASLEVPTATRCVLFRPS